MNFKTFVSLQFSVVSLTFTETAVLGSSRALHTLPLCLLSVSILTSEPKISSNFNPFLVFFSSQLYLPTLQTASLPPAMSAAVSAYEDAPPCTINCSRQPLWKLLSGWAAMWKPDSGIIPESGCRLPVVTAGLFCVVLVLIHQWKEKKEPVLALCLLFSCLYIYGEIVYIYMGRYMGR